MNVHVEQTGSVLGPEKQAWLSCDCGTTAKLLDEPANVAPVVLSVKLPALDDSEPVAVVLLVAVLKMQAVVEVQVVVPKMEVVVLELHAVVLKMQAVVLEVLFVVLKVQVVVLEVQAAVQFPVPLRKWWHPIHPAVFAEHEEHSQLQPVFL